jgi:hypothetical protein
MAVGAHDRRDAALEQVPAEIGGVVAVPPEQRGRVHLQQPPALRELRGERGVAEEGLRPLWVRDDRAQALARDAFGEREDDGGRAQERHLHQDSVRSLEHVASGIVVEQRGGRCEFETKPQLEPHLRAKLGVRLADRRLALGLEGEVRPDVRGRKQDARSARVRLAAERPRLGHGTHAVVPGGNHVGVAIDEDGHPAAAYPPTLAFLHATNMAVLTCKYGCPSQEEESCDASQTQGEGVRTGAEFEGRCAGSPATA